MASISAGAAIGGTAAGVEGRCGTPSAAWQKFWSDLPTRPGHSWEVRNTESHLSEVLTRAGFRIGAAFASEDYPAEHPDMFNVDLLIEDGCPAVAREVLDGYPLFYDQHAISGRRIAAAMAARGYPVGLMWSDLARTCQPKRVHTNGAMLEILPTVERAPGREPMRILAIVHVIDTHVVPDIAERLARIPGLARAVFTLSEQSARSAVESAWNATSAAGSVPLEIRAATSRRLADTAVVFDECGDVVFSEEIDLVVALHTGIDSRLSQNAARYFRRQQLDCILGTSVGYTANVVELFRQEAELGLVFPPTPHIGMSTLGTAGSASAIEPNENSKNSASASLWTGRARTDQWVGCGGAAPTLCGCSPTSGGEPTPTPAPCFLVSMHTRPDSAGTTPGRRPRASTRA